MQMAKVAAETIAECVRKMHGAEALDATVDMSTDSCVTTVESCPCNYQNKIDPKVKSMLPSP